MPVPVLSVESMRAWEAATWADGTTEAEVIDRVGQAIAAWVELEIHPDTQIIFLAGKGHNGDDARAAQSSIRNKETTLINVLDPIEAITELKSKLRSPRPLIVDALFGIGLNRKLSNEWSRLIESINQTDADRVSIDVPSGLNAQTGEAMGASVRANWTLTVGAPKEGMVQPKAQEYVGYIRPLTKVGLGPMPSGNQLFFSVPSDFDRSRPNRRPHDHKGSHGHLSLIAGSQGYHGAAVLAARAAMSARPGLISLNTLPECYLPVASQLQQVMVHPLEEEDVDLNRKSAVVIGPGLAHPRHTDRLARLTAKCWLEAPIPVVVDATSLGWLPQTTSASPAPRIITPHPGEASRLLKCPVEAIEQDRQAAVRSLSRAFGNCWVVLKGPHTLIGTHEGPIFANTSGNPGLAQGGSGDVLAGILGGLLAPPSQQADLSLTLRYAVWHHGAAADHLDRQRVAWTIEDLPQAIGESLASS